MSISYPYFRLRGFLAKGKAALGRTHKAGWSLVQNSRRFILTDWGKKEERKQRVCKRGRCTGREGIINQVTWNLELCWPLSPLGIGNGKIILTEERKEKSTTEFYGRESFSRLEKCPFLNYTWKYPSNLSVCWKLLSLSCKFPHFTTERKTYKWSAHYNHP